VLSIEALVELSDVLSGTFNDKAYGAIIGSCVGDSCGTFTYKQSSQVYDES
jgi:hypothetical protein